MVSPNRLSRKQGHALLLSIILLSVQLTAPDWQASDNMTDYLSPIRGFMDDAISNNLDSDTIAESISDSCNSMWDQFWNVVVVWLTNPSSDMILYGYAFRRHWYWHNNYGPNSQSFVIWKDYNCINKHTVDQNLAPTLRGDSVGTAMQQALAADGTLASDIWQLTSNAVENHLPALVPNTEAAFWRNIGFTAVALNENPNKFSARVCQAVDGFYYKKDSSLATPYFFFGIIPHINYGA